VDEKEHVNDNCMIQVVYEAGEPPLVSDRMRSLHLRLSSALKRRLKKLPRMLAGRSGKSAGRGYSHRGPEDGVGVSPPVERNLFHPGDMVEVLSLEDIEKTLDERGCFEGLGFMHPMRKYCGKRGRVIKKARTIFDERKWKMIKVRNVYLIEGMMCDGRDVFDAEGCDRCCFFFWKDAWLRKVE
jgi:hypothetical protein